MCSGQEVCLLDNTRQFAPNNRSQLESVLPWIHKKKDDMGIGFGVISGEY